MTDAQIVEVLNGKALAIMREPPATDTGDPIARASRLEQAFKYMVCCAILNNEASFNDLKRIVEHANQKQDSGRGH